jgi:hypothetical protein
MFTNIKKFFIYKSLLKKNKELLKINHNIDIDLAWRMYKTYNISEDELEKIKVYGFKHVDSLIKNELRHIDETLTRIKISEFVVIMEAIELNSKQIGLAFRFKYFNTANLLKNILWIIFTLFVSSILFILLSYLGIIIGLFSCFILYLFSKLI